VIVLVAGTGTEVGKTWFCARTIEALRADGVKVAARKPAQSFDPSDPHPTDAEVLGAASGEPPEAVCPPHRWYELPMAPPMAAEALGRAPFTIAELVAELAPSIDSGSAAVTFVETAGGVRSPLAHDGDTVDLCAALRPDLVVLVADAGLGTINAVRLGAAALHEHRLVIALNRFDPAHELHRANRDWLRTRDGLGIVTDPEAVVGEIRRRVGG
jgi:dethiobiotin synthetase